MALVCSGDAGIYAMGALVKEGSEAKTWDELDTLDEAHVKRKLASSRSLRVNVVVDPRAVDQHQQA